jgi:hypothetical protein
MQGLEIDVAGLLWGGDLVFPEERVVARSLRGRKWCVVDGMGDPQASADDPRIRIQNKYRVLLTRFERAWSFLFRWDRQTIRLARQRTSTVCMNISFAAACVILLNSHITLYHASSSVVLIQLRHHVLQGSSSEPFAVRVMNDAGTECMAEPTSADSLAFDLTDSCLNQRRPREPWSASMWTSRSRSLWISSAA